MSKRAKQKANERWPIRQCFILPKEGEHGEIINFDEWLDDYRIWIQSFSANQGYVQGYEQDEKDLALTWEDMELLHRLFAEEEDNFSMHDKYFYTEVLNRFNKSKEEK